MTTIRYFIPEDGDIEDQPNVFLAPKPRQQGSPPTLGQIKQAFPLPGTYHFRFKAPLGPGGDSKAGSMAVWMDCIDDRQLVPVWRNTIVAKVTRIGVEDDDDDDDIRPQAYSAPPQTQTPTPAAPPPQPTPPQPPQPSLDIFGGPSPVHTAPPPAPAASPGPNLFDVPTPSPTHHAPPMHATSPAQPSVGSGDLLGDFGSAGATSAAPAHSDFLGMTASYTNGGTTAAAAPKQVPGYPPQGHRTQQPVRPTGSSAGNTFDSFSQQNGPFGGLGTPWKN